MESALGTTQFGHIRGLRKGEQRDSSNLRRCDIELTDGSERYAILREVGARSGEDPHGGSPTSTAQFPTDQRVAGVEVWHVPSAHTRERGRRAALK